MQQEESIFAEWERRISMDSLRTLKIARNGYITISCVFCILGIFLMANPGCSAKMLCTLIGIIFIISGVIKIIGYFSKDFYCLAFQFDLAFGILMITVGMLMLIRTERLLHLIFVIFGLMILADALFKIQMSLDAKRFGLNLWWRILAVAVLTGIFGTILLIEPGEGAKLTMIFMGVGLLMEGLMNLYVAVYTIKIIEGYSERYPKGY